MFFQTYKYSLLRSVRQRMLLFWSILFPIVLGTLFKVAFGSINENEVMFKQIPVAYVEGKEPQKEFKELLKTLETENEIIKVLPAQKEKAEKLLESDEVRGIFKNDKELTLIVMDEEIDTSILKSIQEQYEQTTQAFAGIAAEHPEKLEAAAKGFGEEQNYLKETGITNQKMDMFTDYFYALIAMNCLYACFSGIVCATEYKANLSALAARRVVASTDRRIILVAEICAKITAQFLCVLIGAIYLQYALKINLGDEMVRILLVMLLGNAVGVMNGVFFGSIGKIKPSVREGLCMGITMLGCFLSGLMVEGMSQIVEEHVPIINRINPATLIVKALYSLNIYETYTKYNQCILSLLGITAVLGIGSYLLVRRERYASI